MHVLAANYSIRISIVKIVCEWLLHFTFLSCVKVISVVVKLNRPRGNIGYCTMFYMFYVLAVNDLCSLSLEDARWNKTPDHQVEEVQTATK